jgi:hypothetical protein
MLKVNYNKWNQDSHELRREAIIAKHPRTRERIMALYEITQGKCPTKVAREIKRRPATVMEWVHKYNKGGLMAIQYKRTGGSLPLFCMELPITSL